MNQFHAKRIADPVHGTIGLSDLEIRVINTRVFQRLRNVHQLGLAHLVFPGANYSRFSHSIGVCFVTGLILENLRRSGVPGIAEDDIQLYRLAGLLHDIGHYPFSHAMEDAIANHYTGNLFADDEPVKFLKHESVSKHVVLRDRELSPILKASGFDPEAIYGIFNREKPLRFTNLVSSDLDADRIDYMLRTAHHTGLPYGSVDIDYLLSQLRVDSTNRLCLNAKATRTAEHFLLCRYFDYQQVAFHKTVAGMEWILKDLLSDLLSSRQIQGTADWVCKAIDDGSWVSFDESAVRDKIRALASQTDDKMIKGRVRALIDRKPPKLLIDVEHLDQLSDKHKRALQVSKQLVREKIPVWATRYGIPERSWHLWEPPIMTLTKIGSRVPVSSAIEPPIGGATTKADKDRDRYDQAIRIFDAETGSSRTIMEKTSSLMSILADHALYSFRLYVLPPDREKLDIRGVRTQIRAELPSLEWI